MFSLYGLTDLCAWFEKKNSFRHLKLHGLRHTFDSLLCSKGIGMGAIKELMGHKSVSTTEIYTHAMTEDKQKAAEVMNNILSAFREEESNAEHAVEFKTIPGVVRKCREIDPDTAINESMLSELVRNGKLSFEQRETRIVLDFSLAVSQI